jgi:hypothetical protein
MMPHIIVAKFSKEGTFALGTLDCKSRSI